MDDPAVVAHSFRHLCGPNDFLLLGGSRVVGLAQGSSDFDVYLIRPGNEWSALPSRAGTIPGGHPAELEIFGVDAVRAEALKLTGATAYGDTQLRALPQERLVRVASLLTAVAAWDPEDRWSALRDRLSVYVDIAPRWHRAWATYLSGLSRLLTRAGDLEGADAASRGIVGHTLDALLVERGELYFSPKYRFVKMARAGLEDLANDAWTFHAPPVLRPRAVGRRVDALIAWGQLHGVRSAGEAYVVPGRRRDATLFRAADETLIVRGTRCWLATEDVAIAWGFLEGPRHWDEIARFGALDERRLAAAVRFLSRRDLLALPPKMGRWATWI